VPLLVAGIAFLIGLLGTIRATGQRAYLAAALMMVIFFHAARLALVDFDPFMSSRPLAEALLQAPPGNLLVDHHYYTYSSIFFYTNRDALLVNGRIKNMEYGSYAPGAPNVFIDDSQLQTLWLSPGRCYLVASESAIAKAGITSREGAAESARRKRGQAGFDQSPIIGGPAAGVACFTLSIKGKKLHRADAALHARVVPGFENRPSILSDVGQGGFMKIAVLGGDGYCGWATALYLSGERAHHQQSSTILFAASGTMSSARRPLLPFVRWSSAYACGTSSPAEPSIPT